MAGRLLGVAVAAVLVHGCLLPQDDQVINDVPAKRNSYPRVREELATPGPVTDLALGTGCKRPVFSVVVEDPDLGDTLRNKWFVDPDGAFSTVSFSTRSLDPSKTAVRNTAVIAPTQLFSAGSKLFDPGPHKLVVVIADGEFEGIGIETTGRTHVVPADDGGTRILIDPSYTDKFQWDVTTSLTPCSP